MPTRAGSGERNFLKLGAKMQGVIAKTTHVVRNWDKSGGLVDPPVVKM